MEHSILSRKLRLPELKDSGVTVHGSAGLEAQCPGGQRGKRMENLRPAWVTLQDTTPNIKKGVEEKENT